MKICIPALPGKLDNVVTLRQHSCLAKNYLERSSGSFRKDLDLQFTAVASCFIPTSLASVSIWGSNFWNRKDLEVRIEGPNVALDKMYNSFLLIIYPIFHSFFKRVEYQELLLVYRGILVSELK